MTPGDWDAAVERLEQLAKGEGYTVDVLLTTGGMVKGLSPWTRDGGLVRMDRPNRPPLFVALEHVVWVRPAEEDWNASL